MAEKALVITLDIMPSKVAKAMEKQKQDCHFQLLGITAIQKGIVDVLFLFVFCFSGITYSIESQK